MQYDNGDVLPRLNEPLTFMGANPMEWGCGLMVFFIISLFGSSPARLMPFMLAGWLGTTIGMATSRNLFPDQERGLRNAILTYCGFPPPQIPAPSVLQPVWSSAPVRALPESSAFRKLHLETIFPTMERDFTEDYDIEALLNAEHNDEEA